MFYLRLSKIVLLTKYERDNCLGLSKAGPWIWWGNAWSKIASDAFLISTLSLEELRGSCGRLVMAEELAGETAVGYPDPADAPSILLC